MNEPKTPDPLHPATVDRVRATRLGLSLDWWAVIIALALAAAARLNWLSFVKW
jgi:hypothetical protein